MYPSGKVIEKRIDGFYFAYYADDSFRNPVLLDVEKWLAYEIGEEAGEVIDRTQAPQQIYTHGHWEEQNVLGWIRVNFRTDADGNKVLFIEEMQSDWHKTARKMRTDEIERIAKKEKISTEEAKKKVPSDFGYAKE